MYEALDVARYVINKSIEIGYPVTNIKLQKVLYFIQKEFIKERGEGCFKEPIVNWRHGAVIEEVYDEYKKYQDVEIRSRQDTYYDIEVDESFQFYYDLKQFDKEAINKEDRLIIDKIVGKYKEVETWDMVKLVKEGYKEAEEEDLYKEFKEFMEEFLTPERVEAFHKSYVDSGKGRREDKLKKEKGME